MPSTDTGTDIVVPSTGTVTLSVNSSVGITVCTNDISVSITAPVVTDTTHQIMYTTVALLGIALIAITILVMVLILTCTQLKRYKILHDLNHYNNSVSKKTQTINSNERNDNIELTK